MNIAQQDHVDQYRKKKMFEGFREFISRGNMIDMAVGVVMGSAVTSVVTSIVKNLISPLISMLFGKTDMSRLLSFSVNGATVSFGAILDSLINFLLVAAAVYFCIIIPLNKFYEFGSKISLPKIIKKTPILSKLIPSHQAKSSHEHTENGEDSESSQDTSQAQESAKTSADHSDNSSETSATKSTHIAEHTVTDYEREQIKLLTQINAQLTHLNDTKSQRN